VCCNPSLLPKSEVKIPCKFNKTAGFIPASPALCCTPSLLPKIRGQISIKPQDLFLQLSAPGEDAGVPGGAALDLLQLHRPAPQQGPRNTLAVPRDPGPRPQLGPIGYVK
jgi:hypothetical protein